MKKVFLLCLVVAQSFNTQAQDGSPDSSFGINGLAVINPVLTASVFDSSGRLIGVRPASEGIEVYRYDSNGNPDAAFGSGGKVTVTIPDLFPNAATVAVRSNGDLLPGVQGRTPEPDQLFHALVRLNSDGSLAAGFGSGGIVVTARYRNIQAPEPFITIFGKLVFANDGRIVEILNRIEGRGRSGGILV
jgi:uncharacterized delta-60 repeat protein